MEWRRLRSVLLNSAALILSIETLQTGGPQTTRPSFIAITPFSCHRACKVALANAAASED